MKVLLILFAVGFLLMAEAFVLNQDKLDLTKHKNWPLVYHDENCGRSKLPLTRKAIGGSKADMGEYPWMARLVYRFSIDGSEDGGCGGSLINKRYVLTAAHCCLDDSEGMMLIHITFGEYDVHRTRDCFRGNCAPRPLEVEYEDMIRHPLYGKKNMVSNDLCLLRLKQDVEFTDYVQPVCLPSAILNEEKEIYGMNLTVTGWGTMQNLPRARYAHTLQKVDVVVRPTELCDVRLGLHFDWESQICAGTGEPDLSPCPGDSGGPAMYYNTTGDSGRYVLMGIVSGGHPCFYGNNQSYPAIYSRVSNAMPWILNSIH